MRECHKNKKLSYVTFHSNNEALQEVFVEYEAGLTKPHIFGSFCVDQSQESPG